MSKLTRLSSTPRRETSRALRSVSSISVWRYPKQREIVRRRVARAVLPYYGASIQEIDPIQVIVGVWAHLHDEPRLPTRFVMLDKAIATLGSVGVELYPDFNVFEIAKPYARDLMIERFTPRRMASRARREGWKLTQMRPTAVPGERDARAGADGQIEVGSCTRPRRIHGQARRGVQPARDALIVSAG